MKSALILYPHQLYTLDVFPEVQTVIMVEEPLYFGVDSKYPVKLHKQKLILHRASMRRYVEEVLWPAGYEVDYVTLDVFMSSGDVLARTGKYDKLYIFDPVDDVLTKRLFESRRERSDVAPIEFLQTPNFYLKEQDVRQYFSEKHQHSFLSFYQWQRERFNILIGSDYKPVGGKWDLDDDKRERLPENHELPSFAVFGGNDYVKEAVNYVNEHFPNNPGSTDFIWPTNHAEANDWLQDFVTHRLDLFGKYADAIDGKAAWVYHSALASSLNCGLLTPQQVVEAALERHQKKPVSLSSLETFVRQILGWREYMRGLYITQHVPMRNSNVFKQQRKMTPEWYTGELGLPPFDDVVKKVNQHAYAHHNERLMVMGNLMMLCEIQPDEVYRWFNELFIDSYDWVLVPNIYGMSQSADGGNIVTKPFISPSSYLLEMSHYQKGDWADVWDGLYWRFIETHKTLLAKNPNMHAILNQLEQLDPDRKRIIGYRAEDFLNRFTVT